MQRERNVDVDGQPFFEPRPLDVEIRADERDSAPSEDIGPSDRSTRRSSCVSRSNVVSARSGAASIR